MCCHNNDRAKTRGISLPRRQDVNTIFLPLVQTDGTMDFDDAESVFTVEPFFRVFFISFLLKYLR